MVVTMIETAMMRGVGGGGGGGLQSLIDVAMDSCSDERIIVREGALQ